MIGGANYQWTGSLARSQLRGRYRASNGWNGEFILNETAASRSNMASASEPPPIQEVEIEAMVSDGDHLLFIGNSAN